MTQHFRAARQHALPVLAGVLLALSHPPVRLLVPVFIGLVPLLVFIARQPAEAEGRWSATRGGIITGAVYFGLQLYWVVVALFRYSLLAIPAYLGMVLVLAGLVGGFAWAVHYTRDRLGLPLALQAAVFWTTLEWVQAHMGDLSFPWLGLGAALAPFPTLAGAADLVGTRGLTFWVAGVNGLIASALLLKRERRSATRPLAALLAVVLVPGGYGVVRTSTLQMKPIARVALIQPGVPDGFTPRSAPVDSALATLTRLTLTLEGVPLDLIAWPEMALPVEFNARDSLRDQVMDLSERVGTPILVGAYDVDRDSGARHNSAFLVDPRHPPDSVPVRYHKRRLVPFIERVPFLAPEAADSRLLRRERSTDEPDGLRLGALEPGVERPIIRHPAGGTFGILICYESIFSDLARDYREAGAGYLVNITNDAWYGREEWWGRTTALWQHPTHLVLRALETRMGVARAANVGFSMFVDPLGRAYNQTPLFEPAVTAAVVYTTDATTLFVRWGDWLAALVAAFGAMALLVARFR